MSLPLLPASPWPAKALGCLIRVMSAVVLSLTVQKDPTCLLCMLADKQLLYTSQLCLCYSFNLAKGAQIN